MKEEAEAAVESAKGVLQDLVVVVSLVRTLSESFGSASDLYRKLKHKSKDKSSDDDNKDDKKTHRKASKGRRDSSSDSNHERGRHRRRHIRWAPRPPKDDFSDSEEELIVTSSSQVRAEYERGYQKLGEPFARGDLVAQNQLQAQIIDLQRTLIAIHQDYMLSTYLSPSSSHSHLIRLIQTTRSARAASIQALHMQYQRLLPPVEPSTPDPHPTVPGAFPCPSEKPPRRDSVVHEPKPKSRRSRSSSSDSFRIQPFPNPPAPAPAPAPTPPPPPKFLFCVYARDLQDHYHLPLTNNFRAGGNSLCPYCHAHIAMRPGKAWEVVMHDCKHGRDRKRIFLVKSRFVVKSHREGNGYACVLCARFKPSDTICRSISALMEHLWRDHNSSEMERDDDIVEIDD